MIVHDVLQGSPEWIALRLGIPTASRFDGILTPKTRKYSATSRKYINELVAEWLLDGPIESFTTFAMERGTELEPEARGWYAFDHDADVSTVGFVTNDDGTVGASPDGLVGDNGLIEIKCPGPVRHVENLFGRDIADYGQVQGNLWVCEREWADVISYHPNMLPCVTRIPRDDMYIADLEVVMGQFLEELEEAKEYVRALGEAGRREIIAMEAA